MFEIERLAGVQIIFVCSTFCLFYCELTKFDYQQKKKGIEIIFRIGLAILEFHKENLMLLDMEGMLKVNINAIFWLVCYLSN